MLTINNDVIVYDNLWGKIMAENKISKLFPAAVSIENSFGHIFGIPPVAGSSFFIL